MENQRQFCMEFNIPQVSIVIPVYNGEKFLGSSIESVISQTFKDWELILVDDASTDRSLEVMKGYEKKDSRIRVISNEKNSGISDSLNNGFKVAKGKYYSWSSDDNMYKSTAIEEMYKYLTAKAGRCFVFCDMDVIDKYGNIESAVELTEKDLYFNCAVGACFMYSAEAAKDVGEFDKKWNLVQDYEFWLRFNKKYRIYHLNKNLYKYRNHESSLTSRKFYQLNAELYNLRMEYLDFIAEKISSEERDKLYVDLIFQNPDKKNFFMEKLYGEKEPESLYWTKGIVPRNEGKKCVIFGCGDYGKKALRFFGEENVLCFVDNDKKKNGRIVQGKEVICYERLKEIKEDYQLVISVGGRALPDIARQLVSDGLKEFVVFIQYIKDIKRVK